MSMRQEFEARFPVPVGVKWDEAHQNYGWVKKQSFQQTITYRALWTGWKESRVVLEIELPPAPQGPEGNGLDGDYEEWETQEAIAESAARMRRRWVDRQLPAMRPLLRPKP